MLNSVAKVAGFARHKDFGWGWFDPATSVMSFFDSPAKPDIEEVVDPEDLRRGHLESEQRVWWFDGGSWTVGRIYGPVDDSAQAYWVEFPNRHTPKVPAIELKVRWDRPLTDIRGMLKNKVAETRFFHTTRSEFIRLATSQGSACQGLTGLLSASTELHSHQLAAARRVLQDPIRRYLLADEVGLGKTIEAGLIARQVLIEIPGKVLITCPGSLTDQWRRELQHKFRLSAVGGSVEIVAFEDLDSVDEAERRLVIVDEAHRLAGTSISDDAYHEIYDRVRVLATRTEVLLLLTATPVRSHEDIFLKLLHLLEPDRYDLKNLDGFRNQVTMRDEIASLLSALDPDLPVEFLVDEVNRASELISQDQTVTEITGEFSALVETGDEEEAQDKVLLLRSHLSDTYRIHRRLIRSRRTQSLLETFPVRGRTRSKDWLIKDHDDRRHELPVLLDEIREILHTLPEQEALPILRVVLCRVSGPIEYLSELVGELRGEGSLLFEQQDRDLLGPIINSVEGRQISDLIERVTTRTPQSTRFDAVIDWTKSHVGKSQVAISSSSTKVAKQLAGLLIDKLGSHRVAVLSSVMSASERETESKRFMEDDGNQCTVLVIDRSAEEGLNLQKASKVLHLDLAISANRIEQRLGRFDRWSDGISDSVESVVFGEADPELDSELGIWRRILDEAFAIFTDSTATLQYVLPEYEEAFLRRFLEDGPVEATNDLPLIKERFENQRRQIVHQDMLDAIEQTHDDVKFIDAIASVDSFPREIEECIRRYAVDALHLDIHGVGSPGRQRGSIKPTPLIPNSIANDIIGDSLSGSRRRTEYSGRRTESVKRGTRLLRRGEPLVDRLLEFAERDDRGRTFLVEVPIPNLPSEVPDTFLFVTDFKITVQPVDFSDGTTLSSEALRLAQNFFPTRFEQVLHLDGVDSAPVESLKNFLQLDSTNLASRPDRLNELLDGIDWDGMCERRFAAAEHEILSRIESRGMVTEALSRFDKFATSEKVIVSRRHQLGLEEGSHLFTYLDSARSAIAQPSLQMDSCGVLILTRGQPE